MDAILVSEFHCGINCFQDCLVHFLPMFRAGPAMVGHRKSHEVKTPVGDPLKVGFLKREIALGKGDLPG